MKTHRMAALALGAVLLAGCKSGGNTELLERDLRLQEDQIYQLQGELDQLEAELESAQRENISLKKEVSGGDRGAAPASESLSAPVLELPSGPARPLRRESSDRPSVPLVEPGVQIDPGEEFDPLTTPAEGAAHTKVTDHYVSRIVLNKQLTGGIQHGRGGDQGVLVVFEPRNRGGQMVSVPGDISIAVLDTSQQGAASRVARWDFSADEAAKQFQKTALGRGFHFELPWPSQPPTSKKLQLFVRYVTPDGRKLMADVPISVTPPGDREARQWRSVPAGSRRAVVAAPARSRELAPAYAPPRAVGRVRSGASQAIAASDSTAPAEQSAGETDREPTAKFLDPPQIIEESAAEELETADGPQLDGAGEDREAAVRRERKKPLRSARPVWTPYR